jgi:hypothetical protein
LRKREKNMLKRKIRNKRKKKKRKKTRKMMILMKIEKSKLTESH